MRGPHLPSLIIGVVLAVFGGVGLVVTATDEPDERVVHVPGYSPECAAEFAAYWRADPDADSATHNAGLRRVKEACGGWPWPIIDALFHNQEDQS